MNTPKKHHISPQFYLKKWCGKDERLYRAAHPQSNKWIFDRKLPQDVAFKKNFYRIIGSDGDHFVFEDETITNLIDTPFSKLYGKIIKRGVENVSKHDRRQFAIYLSSFQARNPRILKNIFEKQYDKITNAPSDLKEISEKLGYNLSDEDMEKSIKQWPEIFQNVKGVFNSKEDFGKWLMRGVIRTSLEEAADKLLDTQWMHVHVRPEYSPIITTDFPMISMGGFGNANSFYVFPLTPCDVLIMTRNIEFFTKFTKYSEVHVIAFLNMIIIGHAKEAYYKNKGHENFIKKYLGCLLDVPLFVNMETHLARTMNDVQSYLPQYVCEMNTGIFGHPMG